MIFSVRRTRFLFLVVCLVIFGCGSDSDYETVDFSDTVESGQQQDVNGGDVLNVAVGAMVSPGQTIVNYQEMIDYISAKIGHEARILQRKTYGEVNDLLRKGAVDIAFICTGPYVLNKEEMGVEAIATPIVRGEPYYRAYLIVHEDSPYQSLADLENSLFAFTDPESNTGALVPTHWLAEMNTTPDAFFRKVHFTYSHDNSIMAVATSLVDAASVDGHIWEYYHRHNPVHTSKTRVVKTSEPFGGPPLVVSRFVDDELRESVAQAVIHMHEDEAGKKILDHLAIDRFDVPREEWYMSAEEMTRISKKRKAEDEKH